MTALALGRSRQQPFRQLRPFVSLVRDDRFAVLRRGLLALALVIAAFHYSLTTLLHSLNGETPLAYLGLVPIIALLLAAARLSPEIGEPSIHDRQVDFILGVPMMLVALVFEILMPIRMSTLFWLYRLDLVALPLFTAGSIVMLFGTRTLWRLRVAVLFLFLAWPVPYSTLLVNWITSFTNSTLAALDVLLRVVHVASPDRKAEIGTYIVSHGRSSFPVSVASACSGVNGIVGYLLVSIGFLTLVVGTWARKLAWLGVGLAGVWVSNVVRIFIILVVGHRYGEGVAIDVLHPVLGLVTFNVIVVLMVLAMRKFGLRMQLWPSRGGFPSISDNLRRAVPAVRGAAVVVGVLALIGGVTNQSLRSYDLVLSSLGSARLASYVDKPSRPAGWSIHQTDNYTWAKPYFGSDSVWKRYVLNWSGARSDLQSSSPIISDVINSSDVSSFSTYGIEACYRFHGYQLHSIRTVDLGHGVTGNVLAYYNPKIHSDWTTVYWHWPVRSPTGKVRYERVTLMLINSAATKLSSPPPSPGLLRQLGLGVQNALAGRAGAIDGKLNVTRAFLVQFAAHVIDEHRSASAPATTPA